MKAYTLDELLACKSTLLQDYAEIGIPKREWVLYEMVLGTFITQLALTQTRKEIADKSPHPLLEEG